jgi:hypothetical protein
MDEQHSRSAFSQLPAGDFTEAGVDLKGFGVSQGPGRPWPGATPWSGHFSKQFQGLAIQIRVWRFGHKILPIPS